MRRFFLSTHPNSVVDRNFNRIQAAAEYEIPYGFALGGGVSHQTLAANATLATATYNDLFLRVAYTVPGFGVQSKEAEDRVRLRFSLSYSPISLGDKGARNFSGTVADKVNSYSFSTGIRLRWSNYVFTDIDQIMSSDRYQIKGLKSDGHGGVKVESLSTHISLGIIL